MARKVGKFQVTNDNILGYDPETRTLAAGQTVELVTWCDWVEILSATADAVSVSFNNVFFFPLAIGLIARPPGGIRRLFIKNTSVAANTILISKGLGEVDDRRVVIAPTTKLKVDPEPTAYGARYATASVAGSAFASTVAVAAGSNLNGILICGGHLICGADPIAEIRISDTSANILAAWDSQAYPISPFTIPAGNQLAVATTGQCRVTVLYRIL